MKTSTISAVLIAILCIVVSDSASAHGRHSYRHHQGCYSPRARVYYAAPRYYQPQPVQVYYAPAPRYCPPPPPPPCRPRYAYRAPNYGHRHWCR